MKKKNPTKHDIRRKIGAMDIAMIEIVKRIATIETVVNDYVEMKKDEKEFEKFLDGKYKQSERKQS